MIRVFKCLSLRFGDYLSRVRFFLLTFPFLFFFQFSLTSLAQEAESMENMRLNLCRIFRCRLQDRHPERGPVHLPPPGAS